MSSSFSEDRILQTYYDQVTLRRKVHHYASVVYHHLDTMTNSPVALLSALVSTLTISTFSIANFTDYANNIVLASGIMQVIVTACIALKAVVDITSRYEQHKETYQALSELRGKIFEQLSLPLDERIEAHHFLNDVQDAYDDSLMADVTIPWWVLRGCGYASAQEQQEMFGASLQVPAALQLNNCLEVIETHRRDAPQEHAEPEEEMRRRHRANSSSQVPEHHHQAQVQAEAQSTETAADAAEEEASQV